MNFGGIEQPYTSLKDATFVVLPIPYDLTSTYQSGSRKGPSAILEASCHMELYDEELSKETYRAGIHTCAPLEAIATGPEEMIASIREAVLDVLDLGKIPVILGGEHSITIGAVLAMRERYQEMTVLQFDAHADMRESYQKSRYSHACVGRRIMEIFPLLQMGVRSMSAEEAEFIASNRVRSFSVEVIRESGRKWESILQDLCGDVYISIDVDVFDPSIMPSTGTPEPGGIHWHEMLSILREVCSRSRVRGFDIVELSPIPGIVAPDFLTAKLAYRVMGYIIQGCG